MDYLCREEVGGGLWGRARRAKDVITENYGSWEHIWLVYMGAQ